jgi:hypothetical protein
LKLKNMKITAAEQEARKEKYSTMPAMPGDEYPYDLKLRLGDESLDKLGIDKLPAVGKKMRIEAECVVVSTNQSAGKDHSNRSIELQIQKLGVSAQPQSAVDAMDDALEDL